MGPSSYIWAQARVGPGGCRGDLGLRAEECRDPLNEKENQITTVFSFCITCLSVCLERYGSLVSYHH